MIFWKGETPLQLIASCIWNMSESLKIPLGRFAHIVFGWMIGRKLNPKCKLIEDENLETKTE